MRAIINISSDRAADAAGWRAKPIVIKNKGIATLAEIFKAAKIRDGSTLFDLLVGKDKLKSDWTIYVNGLAVSDFSDMQKKFNDSSQIHILNQFPIPK